ncbi:protein US11b [Cynomolgus macaque cytomegalovirus strain Mauritius]|uniref:Protein US11b n=1 Tax=Cynomolgus macaque cytomegalovirus strain Mauritius TaxID=1690255 RepID=A0A0K1H097_9BETA|nr:protein US11b [Cynomolgus macaque cytomegalovirus strain Mauritius]AXG21923.1 protein US11b [synthetic construct]AXG22192.1 protein US11b [synthetic construct]
MKLGGNILTGHISRHKVPFISHVQPLKSKASNNPFFSICACSLCSCSPTFGFSIGQRQMSRISKRPMLPAQSWEGY